MGKVDLSLAIIGFVVGFLIIIFGAVAGNYPIIKLAGVLVAGSSGIVIGLRTFEHLREISRKRSIERELSPRNP